MLRGCLQHGVPCRAGLGHEVKSGSKTRNTKNMRMKGRAWPVLVPAGTLCHATLGEHSAERGLGDKGGGTSLGPAVP